MPDMMERGEQCRLDGKNNPGPGDGKDTIPSFVDAVMIEGMEDLEEYQECAQHEAPGRIKCLHLTEVAHTDDKKWDQNSKEKYTKYGSLQQLLKKHGLNTKLHVMVCGRTSTVYNHNQKVPERLGLNKKEVTQSLKELHDLTVSYAHNMYQLYRQLRQESQTGSEEEDENHPA
ncbi:hypothetical protein CYMTET_16512 [Cymbomonas tetramitiformis]|uniref:Uncharacterized protein n=1 Tax=Cymbomonas tetramitiformis TaxID=36881 RepID=A0AAE0L7V1_9CHLO|nr:hypothetical protein CYMTET_16512 [Cymbomonas tetramitiformis]